MVSFDVSSFFTNVPLAGAIDLCLDKLFDNTKKVNNLNRQKLKYSLNTALKQNNFMFNNTNFDQTNCVTMGSRNYSSTGFLWQ